MLSQPNDPAAKAGAVLPGRTAPVHEHDCDHCVYLGTTLDLHERYVDLWVHPHPDEAFRTIIARWSPDGPDYMSGLVFRGRYPLSLAYRLAVERELIPADPDR